MHCGRLSDIAPYPLNAISGHVPNLISDRTNNPTTEPSKFDAADDECALIPLRSGYAAAVGDMVVLAVGAYHGRHDRHPVPAFRILTVQLHLT
jgi:hypothetical protein